MSPQPLRVDPFAVVGQPPWTQEASDPQFWLNIVPKLQKAVHPDRIPARPRLGRALEMLPGLNFVMYTVLWEALTINGKDLASVTTVLVGWQSHSKYTQAFCDPCRLLNTNDDEIDLDALQRPAAIWAVGAPNSTLPDGYRFWPPNPQWFNEGWLAKDWSGFPPGFNSSKDVYPIIGQYMPGANTPKVNASLYLGLSQRFPAIHSPQLSNNTNEAALHRTASSQRPRPGSPRSSAIQDRRNAVPRAGEKRTIDLTQSNDEVENKRTISPKRVKATHKATSAGEMVLLSNDREIIDLDAVEDRDIVEISDDDEVTNVKTEQIAPAGVPGPLIKYKAYYTPKKTNFRGTWSPGQTVPAGPPGSTFHTNRPRITRHTPQPRLFERANPKYRWNKGRLYIWVGQLKDIQVFNGVEQVTILPNRVEACWDEVKEPNPLQVKKINIKKGTLHYLARPLTTDGMDCPLPRKADGKPGSSRVSYQDVHHMGCFAAAPYASHADWIRYVVSKMTDDLTL